MEYRDFGRTGFKVSLIGMGTYYDGAWIITAMLGWRRGADRKVAALRMGIEGGINFIDTAEIYGSEPLVRRAVEAFRRDELFIATKVWPNHLRRDSLLKALDRSLRRLGTSYVDLYQVHWPNPRVPIEETMNAMEYAVKMGKVRFIGVSNFSLMELIRAREALKREDIVSIQVSYSLLDRRIEGDLMPYCRREGIEIIAYYPLGHGKLASDERLRRIGARYGKTPAQVALNWLIMKGTLPIPRASNPDHVKENLGSVGWRLSEDDVAELDRFS